MSFKDLKITRSPILPELMVFEPSVFWDLRGNIYTSFLTEHYLPDMPEPLEFVHDKFAQSKFNVLRGLHGDRKTWKLVSCVWGEIYEVVVDMRKESPRFRQWDAFELSSDHYRQVLIPPGFVNGYYVKSDHAIFHYKLAYTGEYIDAGEQMTYIWNDPELKINWPCQNPILQARDK
ncbi:MAG: dTDP-4-dehydrorhamnose 3,5-epimerase family protein [Bacteroidales bacterium]|nr:dTDP-4-dehydrorhamnose 3,5-epimerase family protein [Bacteroidales bacterium]